MHKATLIKVSISIIILSLLVILHLTSKRLPIWQDEAYTIYTSKLSPADAWNRAITFEEQSPLYYLLVSIFEKIDKNFISLRYISVFFIMGTCILILCQRNADDPLSDIIVFIVLLPHFIWAGTEIRLYGMSIFLSFLLLHFLKNAKKCKIYFLFLSIITILNFYTNFLSTITAGLLFFYYSIREKKISYILIYCISIIIFLPVLLSIFNNIIMFDGSANIREITLKTSFHNSLQIFLSLSSDARGIWFLRILKWTLIITMYIVLFLKDKPLVFINLLAVITFSLIIWFSRILGVINYRHFLVLLPIVYLNFDSFLRASSRKAILIPFMIISLINFYSFLQNPKKEGSWNEVALAASKYDVDKVLFFAAESIYPFEIYYNGMATIHTIPNDIDRKKFDIVAMQIQDKGHLEKRVNELLNDDEDFLLVGTLDWKKYRGISFNNYILAEYIKTECEILEHEIVDGTHIYLLRFVNHIEKVSE